MLKRIIGAAIGAKLAKNSPAVGGATGAALGAAVPWVIGRLSLPGMIALAAGGYVAKRYMDRRGDGDGMRQLPPPAHSKPAPVPAQVDL
jgi:hypothetical protein